MLAFGPAANAPAPQFTASTHTRDQRTLAQLLGERGLLLGFTSGIWNLANIRRVLWLQRHLSTLEMAGVNPTLIVHDELTTIYDFVISSPVKLEFPILADVDGQIHAAFNLQGRTALVLIDRRGIVTNTWFVGSDRIWAHPQDIMHALQLLDRTSV